MPLCRPVMKPRSWMELKTQTPGAAIEEKLGLFWVMGGGGDDANDASDGGSPWAFP